MDILDHVLARAEADPGVRGVILSGSRARGTENAWSDYDLTIVVAEQAQPWRHSTRTDTLVDRQATLSVEEAALHARSSLDAYLNQLYRCVKSRRDGYHDAALLDEMESLPWLLVFALHGRLRPLQHVPALGVGELPAPRRLEHSPHAGARRDGLAASVPCR